MKKALAILLALCVVFSLSAVSASADDVTELTFWHCWSGGNAELLEAMVEAYNASHSDVHITATYQGDYWEAASKAYTAVATGEAPDLLMMGTDHVSIFMKEGGIVTEALLSLSRGDTEEISAKVREYTEKRTKSQPLNFPSAGSMFKRPVGHYTGALIEQCGLKGTCVGGAQVSEKHAGFVINKGEATASDIDGLVKKIQSEVKAKFDVDLEREVRFIGRGFSSPNT